MTLRRTVSGRLIVGVYLIVFTMAMGCGSDLPSECGQNVKRVTSLNFAGPSVIPSQPGYASYDVSISIEKNDRSLPSRVCYAIREEDSWLRLFWSVDDVLDFYFMDFPPRQETKTAPGQFLLENRDDEVCGTGALPGAAKVRGCSGESEAQVYMQPMGSPGPSSPNHLIRIQ